MSNNTGDIPPPIPIMAMRYVNWLVDFCGLLLFGAIIIVTIRHKKLHGTCHLLIGLFCVCNFFSKLLGIFAFLLVTWSSIGSGIPYILWCAILFLPLMIMHGVHPFMLLIGFDRLMSIAFPIWYKTKNGKLYLLAVLAIPIGFEIFIAIVMLLNMTTHTGIVAFLVTLKPNYPIINFLEIGFNLLSFACYFLMFGIMLYNQKKDQSSSASSFRQSLYKSMFLIILLQFVCWMFTLLGQMVINYLNIQTAMQNFWPTFLNLFIAIPTNLEVPLLYYTSTAHRNALRTEFGWLLPKGNSSVSAIGIGIQIQTTPIIPMHTTYNALHQINRRPSKNLYGRGK